MNFEELVHRIDNSKPVDFGNIISKSFELYKTYFIQGLIHTLIIFLFAIPLLLIVFIPIVPFYIELFENIGNPYYRPSIFDDVSIPMLVLWYLMVFLFSFIDYPFLFIIQ